MNQEAYRLLLHLRKKTKKRSSHSLFSPCIFQQLKKTKYVYCCGYIVGCLQQPSRLIGRALNDLHEQESIFVTTLTLGLQQSVKCKGPWGWECV
jgi:hypothetical protein